MLSSYRLLELLEFMDENGAFKAAAERGGHWPDWKQMIAEGVNESYRSRALYLHAKYGEDAAFDLSDFYFVDPVTHRERQKAEEAEAKLAAVTEPEIESAGW